MVCVVVEDTWSDSLGLVFGYLIQFDSVLCTPLPSVIQHPSYGDCLEVKREYYQNCSMLDCVTQL